MATRARMVVGGGASHVLRIRIAYALAGRLGGTAVEMQGRYRLAVAAIALGAVLVACGGSSRAPETPPASTASAATQGRGPKISIGTPSFANGKLVVPVSASGASFDPYETFGIHLRWTPGMFTFSSASGSGGVLDPASGNFCAPANTAKFDADGGGVTFGCVHLGGSVDTSTGVGLMATFSLTPGTAGCTALHLFTYGPPDGGTKSDGTMTLNPKTGTAQANAYGPDVAVDANGNTCTPGPGSAPTVAPQP
jgi:hypothetical protein